MAKPKQREVKFSAKEMADDLPYELDSSKLKLVGRGKDAVFAERPLATTVILDADVAKVFGDAESVNNALRGLIELARQSIKKVKKTPRRIAS